MDAIMCACGRRIEREYPSPRPTMYDLRTAGHDPDECSRQIGFQSRLRGRHEMVDRTMEHLLSRNSLGPNELSEIRTELVHLAGML